MIGPDYTYVLEAEIAALRDQVATHDIEVSAAWLNQEGELEWMRAQLAIRDHQISRLQSKVERCQRATRDLTRQVENLRRRLTRANERVDALTAGDADVLEDQRQAHKLKAEALMRRIAELEAATCSPSGT